MKIKSVIAVMSITCLMSHLHAQTIDAYEIKFRNSFGGDDSDPYRLRKVNSSSNENWLELQLNDDLNESFRIYGNSCVGYGCGEYSGNLYHIFDASGNVYHSGKLGFGTVINSRRIGLWDQPDNWYGLGIGNAQFRLQVGTGGRFSFLQNDNTEVFTVMGGGSVGVGASSPSARFHVSGANTNGPPSMKIENTDAAAASFATLQFKTGITTNVWQTFARNGDFNVGIADVADYMTIKSDGKFGIGTTTPSSQLNVKGSSAGELSKFETTNSTNSYVNVSNAAGSVNVGIGSNGSTAGYGYLWSGSGNFMIGSDGNPTIMVNGMGNGTVGIGHAPASGYKLAVGGKVLAENVTVKLQANWPDYVFEKSYALPTLDELKSYIDENKHLPEVPTAKEVEANGMNVGEMNMLLLKKVEELTLHLISMKEQLSQQQAEIKELKTSLSQKQ